MSQIQKGTTYTSSGAGSQVTHTNLNAHVDNATLVAGAIDDQINNPVSDNTDNILITKSGTLYRQNKLDFTSNLTTKSIDAGVLNDFTITAYDGTTVTGSNYVSDNGLLNTVTTSVAHNLSVGQVVLISGANNYFYNGYYRITSIPTTTKFTYELNMFDMYSGTGNFNSTNGVLVTVTTSTSHNFVDNQPLKIIASNTLYSGTFIIDVLTSNTFTYTLTTSTTAGSGTISYITTSAIAGNGTLSYQKMAVTKINGSHSVTGSSYHGGTTDLIGDVYVKGKQIVDGSVTNNGTVTNNSSLTVYGDLNVNGKMTYNGLNIRNYYDMVHYYATVPAYTTGKAWTSPVFSKPSDEFWQVELIINSIYPNYSSGQLISFMLSSNSGTLYSYNGIPALANLGGIGYQQLYLKTWLANGTSLTNETINLYLGTNASTLLFNAFIFQIVITKYKVG